MFKIGDYIKIKGQFNVFDFKIISEIFGMLDNLYACDIDQSVQTLDNILGKLNSKTKHLARNQDKAVQTKGKIQNKKEKLEMVEKELDIKVFGMVKNDKHQTRALMDENRNELSISENLMKLITRFQDTVHDTAITYHRKLRDKEITKSALDDIKGIGKVKKQALLKQFGSVEKMKQAPIEELMKVKGITKELAEKLKQ